MIKSFKLLLLGALGSLCTLESLFFLLFSIFKELVLEVYKGRNWDGFYLTVIVIKDGLNCLLNLC